MMFLSFELADTNCDGKIDIAEFVSLMFPSAKEALAKLRKAFKGPDDVSKKFKIWDANGDGKISFDELKESAAKDSSKFLSDEDINAIFIYGDLNLDGEIDEAEFAKLMIPSIHDIVAKFRYAHRSVEDVRKAFKTYDRDGDGAIDKGELHKALTNYKFNFSDQEVDIIFAAGDIDGDGHVDFEEFMYLMCPSTAQIVKKFRDSYKTINEVKAAFRKYEKNRDGGLSKGELNRMMMSTGHSFTDMEVDAIMNLGDKDGDGEIDLDEFMILMTPTASETLSKIRKGINSIADVKGLFKAIDVDGDGLLSKEEMLNSPGCKFDKEQIEAIYELGDSNGDLVLDMEEFIGVMYPSAATVAGRLRGQYTDINDVKKAFAKIDLNGDGKVSKEEVASTDLFNSQEIDALFTLGDANNDGEIDLEEFVGVLYPVVAGALAKMTKDIRNVDDARYLFKSLDFDGDGLLSQEELRKSGCKFSAKEIEALFAIGDVNGDGELDINEFINVMCPGATTVISRISSLFKSMDDIEACFNKMDLDGDGKLTRTGMMEANALNEQEVNAIFELGDTNRDESIDLQEFISVMTTCSPVAYAESGAVVKVGDTDVYVVGSGPKCVIWCHDMKGFASEDRTRQLVDKFSEQTGWLIVLPDFLGEKKIEDSSDEYSWLSSITDWNTIKDFWVERLLPYLRSELGVKAIGVLGTGWGSYLATRLSSYEEVLAGVNIQPLISSAVEAAKEDLYELFEDVRCPQLMLSCRNNCPNEKPGGLAANVFNSSPVGKKCEFTELHDMMHGFLLEGERSIEAIVVQSRLSMNRASEFLNKFLHYPGEPAPVPIVCCAKDIDDFDIKTHSSDSCKTCLEIQHQANKAAARCM